MRASLSESRVALVLFIALAALHTWPLGAVPWRRSLNYHADAQLNAWIVRWIAHAIATQPTRLFDGNIFAPERGTITYSEPLVVPALAAAPAAWAGASPTLLFNLLDMAGLVLTAWSAWFVIRRWTGSQGAALLGGALVAFNVHVLTRLPHLAATHLWGLPLALYFADALIERPSVKSAAALALVVAATAATSLYSLMLAGVIVAAVAIAGARHWRGVVAIAVAGLGGLVVATPVLLPYVRLAQAGATRPIETVAQFSATLAGHVTSTSRIHTWWSRPVTNDVDVFFAGATALVLAGVGLARGVPMMSAGRRRLVTLAIIAGAGVLLSLGPATPVYRWIYDVFAPLRGIRAAARFGMLALVAVAVAAALGAAWLERRTRVRPVVITCALLAAVTLEAWQGPVRTIPAERAPAVYQFVKDATHPVLLVEVPFFPPEAIFENGEYVFNATAHWRPVMNGYSGYTPASYRRRAAAFWFFPEDWAINAIKAEGATHVMVHLERFGSDAPAVRRVLDGRSDMILLAADPIGHRLYKIK